MIDITPARGPDDVKINEKNIVALKPQPSGETDIFFDKNVPLPRRSSSIVRKFRITEGADDLAEVELKKYETVSEGKYWYLNPEKILSETKTKKGKRIYLASDVSDGGSPFSNFRLHLQEVS